MSHHLFRTDFQRMELAHWYEDKDPATGESNGYRIAHMYHEWFKVDRGNYQTTGADNSHAAGDVWRCRNQPNDLLRRGSGGPWVLTRTVGTEQEQFKGRWASLEDAQAYQDAIVRAEEAILEERRNPRHFEAFEMQFGDPS